MDGDQSTLKRLLTVLKEIAAAVPQWLLAVLKAVAAAPIVASAFVLLCVIVIHAYHMRHQLLLDNIAVPKVFEDQGYTSQVMLDLVRDNIEQIQRVAQTEDPNRVELASASAAALPDITLPMTSLSYRSIVSFVQETFGWQPQRVTGEITAAAQDPSKDCLVASVHVENFRRTSVLSFRQRAVKGTDPDKIGLAMAQDILHLTSPYVLASYFKAKRDNKEALKLIEESVEEDDVSQDLGLSLRAAIYMTQHNFAEAINVYKTLANKNRHFFDAHYLLAIALLEEQQPNLEKQQCNVGNAIAEYQTAIAIEPHNLDVHNGLGRALSVNKQPPDIDGAIKEFREAIKTDPNKSAFAYNGWGYALLARAKRPSECDDAIEEFKKAIEIDSKFADAHSNLDSALDTKQCLKIASDPKSASSFDCLGHALLAKRPPDCASAIGEYQKAIAIEPRDVRAHNGLGDALLAKHPPDLDGAIEEFNRAIEIDSKFADARSNLDSALDTRQCLKIASDPKSASSFDCWGDALLAKRPPDYAGAIGEYQTAIAIEPRDVRAHNGLGDALLAQRPPDLDGAIAEYRSAIEFAPHDVHAFDGLGDALLAKEPPDVESAIAEYQTAIAIAPQDVRAYDGLGDALLAKQLPNVDGAMAEYRKAMGVEPHDVRARNGLTSARGSSIAGAGIP